MDEHDASGNTFGGRGIKITKATLVKVSDVNVNKFYSDIKTIVEIKLRLSYISGG